MTRDQTYRAILFTSFAPSLAFVFLSICFLFSSVAQAKDRSFFRIDTGNTSGTYFPIGKTIATAVSMPPGAEECDQTDEDDGPCGVPGVIAMVQASKGSIANVKAIQSGKTDSGLVQADIAYRAFAAEDIFSADGPYDKLRAIASLYPETVHLIARKGSQIKQIHHLKNKRVSLGQVGSGTRTDAETLLMFHGIRPGEYQDYNLSLNQSAEKLLAGELDAFFLIGGYPAPALVDLAQRDAIELVPIDSEAVDNIMQNVQFFSRDVIPPGTYGNLVGVRTVSVAALWLTSTDQSDETVYELTKALWAPANRSTLKKGHAKGEQITLDTALDGVPILLHPGAEKFYLEAGVIEP